MAGWIRDQAALPSAIAHQLVDLLLRRNLLGTGELPLGAALWGSPTSRSDVLGLNDDVGLGDAV